MIEFLIYKEKKCLLLLYPLYEMSTSGVAGLLRARKCFVYFIFPIFLHERFND